MSSVIIAILALVVGVVAGLPRPQGRDHRPPPETAEARAQKLVADAELEAETKVARHW